MYMTYTQCSLQGLLSLGEKHTIREGNHDGHTKGIVWYINSHIINEYMIDNRIHRFIVSTII